MKECWYCTAIVEKRGFLMMMPWNELRFMCDDCGLAAILHKQAEIVGHWGIWPLSKDEDYQEEQTSMDLSLEESHVEKMTEQQLRGKLEVTELWLQEAEERLEAARKWCIEVRLGLLGALSYAGLRSLVEGITRQVEELKEILGVEG